MRPTENSVPELHGTSRSVSSGQTAASPEESSTEKQQLQVAIFMYKPALQNSLRENMVGYYINPTKKYRY